MLVPPVDAVFQPRKVQFVRTGATFVIAGVPAPIADLTVASLYNVSGESGAVPFHPEPPFKLYVIVVQGTFVAVVAEPETVALAARRTEPFPPFVPQPAPLPPSPPLL